MSIELYRWRNYSTTQEIKEVFALQHVDGSYYCRTGTYNPSVWSTKSGAAAALGSIPKPKREKWTIKKLELK